MSTAQGRPFASAYCVLSVFDGGEDGVRVSAYNSDSLEETDMVLSWEVAAGTVPGLSRSLPVEVRTPCPALPCPALPCPGRLATHRKSTFVAYGVVCRP